MRVEYSHPNFRNANDAGVEVRAAGRFSATEVREICERTGLKDFRQIGCPEWIFVRVLESRAKKISFTPTPEKASTPAPDLADRLDYVSLF